MINSKTGHSLPMCFGGTHTLRISYQVNMFIKSSSVGLDINVDQIDGNNLYLSYSGGIAIEMMVRTALNRVKGQPGADMIEMLSNNRLLIALGRSPQLSQIFERVTLDDIYFDEKFIIIEFHAKS